jgi:uncharacterized protein
VDESEALGWYDPPERLIGLLEVLGLRGVMLHPWEELCAINSAPLDPLLTYATEHALPLLIEGGHSRVSEASQIGELARRFPEAMMIVTHAGQLNISGRGLFDAARLFEPHANVLLETSAVYRQDFVGRMVSTLGAQRMVVGSGSPRFDQETEMARVQHVHVSDVDTSLILGGTRAALLRSD